jgi:hypothetical protein
VLYSVERRTVDSFLVERDNSFGTARVMHVSVGKATGPMGPGSAFERMSMPGNLQTGVGIVPIRFKRPVNIASIYADVPPGNQSSGLDIIFDANINGVTAFTNQANRPRIAAGTTEGAAVVPDVTFVPANGKVTIDVDQVGSVVAGANAMVTIEYY